MFAARVQRFAVRSNTVAGPAAVHRGFLVRLAVIVVILFVLGLWTPLNVVAVCLAFVVLFSILNIWSVYVLMSKRRSVPPSADATGALAKDTGMYLAERESKIVEAMAEMNDRAVISIPKIGPFDFSITNTVLYMWVSAAVVFTFFFVVAKRMKKSPDGLQTTAEILLNFATGHLTGQIGEKGKKYYYLILTLFSYIMVTNLIGLIPKPIAPQAHHADREHQRHVRSGHGGVLRHAVPGLQASRGPQVRGLVARAARCAQGHEAGPQRHLLRRPLHGRVLQAALPGGPAFRQYRRRPPDHPGDAGTHPAVRGQRSSSRQARSW